MNTESLLGRLATVHTRTDSPSTKWTRQFQGILRGADRNGHVGGFLLDLTESTGKTDHLEDFRNVPGGLLVVQVGERVMVSVEPIANLWQEVAAAGRVAP
jgi:hypothetical protein